MAYIDKKTAMEKVIEALNPSAIKAIQAKTAIEKIPIADVVEVKHGKWEKRTFIVFDNEIKDGYNCSECNTTWDTDTKYCPNCGAIMDGVIKC